MAPHLSHPVLSPRRRSKFRRMQSYGGKALHGFKTRHNAVIFSLWAFVTFIIAYRHLNHQHTWAPAPVDVVGIAVKPTCINEQAIAALNVYLQPRHIHVVTTTAQACAAFSAMAHNVICHEENTLLKGVTHASVSGYLSKRLQQQGGGEGQFKGRSLAGWYLQQFLKLGAAQAIPSLTDHFVIWDLDMILLRPLKVLTSHRGVTQTVVNVGGARHVPGYVEAYHNLTGRTLEFAPDGSSFVTHWIVVYKPYMAQFLSSLQPPGKRPPRGGSNSPLPRDFTAWVWTILDAVPLQHVHMGFSEYASYISWVKQTHPQSQHILPRRTWVRTPFGPAIVRMLQRLHPQRCCCPSDSLLSIMKLLRYQYTGFEAGHIASCAYNSPQHKQSYCIARR